MRNSLFLKVYATLLATLAVVAIASFMFVRMGMDEQDRGWANRRDHFLAAMLPPDADPAAIEIVLDRLAVAFDGDIAVFGPGGNMIAAAGNALPPELIEGIHGHHGGGGLQGFVTRLPDGRYVAARVDMPFGPGRRNLLRYLALVAAVAGLAAYPVVRHLTRRLEGLRRGVEDWGAGALDRRVAVEGTDEVAAVAATFNQAADRVERLVEAHRSLLANASHELRSPLARLRIAIDLYERSASEDRKREIVRNLGELDSLVEEILLASRLDHNDRLDLVEAVDLLALTAEEGARNGVAVSGEPATVQGDPRLLTRLVRNLMQNALRHGAPPVTAELKSANGTVELRIRDHGPGIPADEDERVFEPFYRPSGRGETAGGWGLGLSLVRHIARHHKASVRIEAPADGGACFVVAFQKSAS
ncbi:MAG: HAMP domain-containing protein [Mesorhizobium sp.]|nr:ATP-binding protein [Mesorhizobium sp.]RWB25775.1 MAG: HAMP domain-containing protein [Mesorhizobium sp.]